MVGTPTSRRAVYYFADYEESEYQGRQRITRQHVTVPETVPTPLITKNSILNFIKKIIKIKDLQKRKLQENKSQRRYVQRGSRLHPPPLLQERKRSMYIYSHKSLVSAPLP
jgi:hypothetical protein